MVGTLSAAAGAGEAVGTLQLLGATGQGGETATGKGTVARRRRADESMLCCGFAGLGRTAGGTAHLREIKSSLAAPQSAYLRSVIDTVLSTH